MKEIHTVLAEAMSELSLAQGKVFTRELKEVGGKLSVEARINLCKKIKSEPVHESAPIRRNNGSEFFTESHRGSTQITELQERQVNAWKAMGMSEVEAEVAAGVHDRALKVAAVAGKSAGEFCESLRKSRGEGQAENQSDLKRRQDQAYRLMR